jgi:hypothetical protein
MVEHLTQKPKVKGSDPGTSTGREKNGEKGCTICKLNINKGYYFTIFYLFYHSY